MATLPNVYDDDFTQAVAAIAGYESSYFAQNGRYRQLLNLQEAGLSDPQTLTVRVDIYQAPNGYGYVVVGEAVVSGVSYRRTENVGPESDRTHGWIEIGQENV